MTVKEGLFQAKHILTIGTIATYHLNFDCTQPLLTLLTHTDIQKDCEFTSCHLSTDHAAEFHNLYIYPLSQLWHHEEDPTEPPSTMVVDTFKHPTNKQRVSHALLAEEEHYDEVVYRNFHNAKKGKKKIFRLNGMRRVRRIKY